MVTKQVDPWDLDEYAGDLHHRWTYWATKAREASEASDDEKVEKYTGKMACLIDKLVALCKVRDLWWNSYLVRRSEVDDLVENLDLDPETKQELLSVERELKKKLTIARAQHHFANMKNEIDNAEQFATLVGWTPSLSANHKKRSVSSGGKG
jgi:hypothetical protein